MIDPTTPTAPTIPAPTLTAPVEPHGQAPVTPNEAATLAQWAKEDLAQNRITPQQADTIFSELNIPLEQRGPDTRTNEQRLVDEHFPVAKPHEFVIRWNAPGDMTPMSPELKVLDTSARGWMSSAGLPVNVGNSLVNQITKVLQATRGLTESQIEQRGYDEFDKLKQVHGDKLDERLDAVNRLVHAIESTSPGVYRFLTSQGIADDAMVMNILITHAPIYHARRKGR